jgi:hypothetical protein
LTVDSPAALVGEGLVRCVGCVGLGMLFGHQSGSPDNICSADHGGITYDLRVAALTLSSDTLLSYSPVLGVPVPAAVFQYCMSHTYFKHIRAVPAPFRSHLIDFSMSRLDGTTLLVSNAVNATVEVVARDCRDRPFVCPSSPVVLAHDGAGVNVTVACPANLTDLAAMRFDLPFAWSLSASPLEIVTSAKLTVVPPGLSLVDGLVKIEKTDTDDVEWGFFVAGAARCTHDGYDIVATLRDDANSIELKSFAPAYVYERCLRSLKGLVDPTWSESAAIDESFAALPRSIRLSVVTGLPGDSPVITIANTPVNVLLTTECDSASTLLPSVVGAVHTQAFGPGCLRKGEVALHHLFVAPISPDADLAVSRITFTCSDCSTAGVFPKVVGGELPGGSWVTAFSEVGGECYVGPTSSIHVSVNFDGVGGWSVFLTGRSNLPSRVRAPTLAEYMVCLHNVHATYGYTFAVAPRRYDFAISVDVGARVHAVRLPAAGAFILSNATCDTCFVRILPPYIEHLGDHIRTLSFPPAPLPVPSAQLVSQLIPVVPLGLLQQRFVPSCPVCGFRMEILHQGLVWGQDMLVCPPGLARHFACRYVAAARTLVLTMPPGLWNAMESPGHIEHALQNVAFFNTEKLHVQGLRSFSLSFQQCSIEGEAAWSPAQYFPGVELLTTDNATAPVCPRLRTGGSVIHVSASQGPVNVEPLVLLEGLLEYEPQGVVGAQVYVTNCIPGEDILDIDPVVLHQLHGITWRWIPDTCKMHLEGGRPFVDYALLLRNVRYRNAKGERATEGDRTVQMYVWTPRCASRSWYSTLKIKADCAGRCICSPRFGLNVLGLPMPLTPTADWYTEAYYRQTGVAVHITEVQAPLPASNNGYNNQYMYCDHAPHAGGLLKAAKVCIGAGFEVEHDVIVFNGHTSASWAALIAGDHDVNVTVPAIVSTHGFELEGEGRGCLHLVPTAPLVPLPSSVFISAINDLTFRLGGPGSVVQDREVSVEFHTVPSGRGASGHCEAPPVKVLLQVPANGPAARVFHFGTRLVDLSA